MPTCPPHIRDLITELAPDDHTVLSLTRKRGQSVILGDPANPIATVTVIHAGATVRLAVSAGPGLSVLREELALRELAKGGAA